MAAVLRPIQSGLQDNAAGVVRGTEAFGRGWRGLKSGISNNKGMIAFLFIVAAVAIPLAVSYHMPATRGAMHHFSHQVNQLYKHHPLAWIVTGIVALGILGGVGKLSERRLEAAVRGRSY